MKKIIQTIVKVLTFLVNCLSHINLRGLVIIGGLILAIFAPKNQLFQPVDSLVLKANSYLFKSPLGSSEIAVIRVPTEELNIWQSDIHSSGNLALLLSNVLNSPNTTIGIILDQPMDTGAGAADVLIEDYIKESSSSVTYKNANALVDRKFILTDLISNERVVLGVDNFTFTGQKPLLTNSPLFDQFPLFLTDILWPQCAWCFSPKNSVEVERPRIAQHSLIEPQSHNFQALYLSDQGEVFNGFLVEFLRAVSSVNPETNLVWNRGERLKIGRISIPMSTSAQYIPLHAIADRLSPFVNKISLSEALARSAFPDFIFIADDKSELAVKFASALYSIQHDSVFYSPWWQSPLLVLLIIFVTLYLGVVVSRISLRLATVITIATAVLILVGQAVAIFLHGFWLPVALPIAWLLCGHLLLVIWVVKKRRVQSLIDRADNICIAQAKSLVRRKELDQAVAQLEYCSSKDPLLQTLYDISDAYAEQKNFAKAEEVLGTVRKKRKSFKDTEQKLQVLKTMLKTQKVGGNPNEYLQKTMVISGQQENRSLGRYQLEKEIGRGAMGKVYLGFDPRISRRLAIKTLSYDHFNGKERQDIKSRFFREAEAAGRLSHPSIVSVYDVGEENEQAYIAMDFADGDALSNFVSADNLLPVFEVYRIVYDVAVALEYAHENNIVHRDVKPGNIIYNPSPYQIRVTDFGIARLTDDSKTSTGEILGSPLYMAPEQLKGKKVNRAADIFSLGVTFYQLLTGHLPYSGDNLAALTYEIIHGKHKSVRSVRKDLPTSASRITNQALQKDAADRYETAAEMALVLKKAIKRDFAAQAKRVGYI